MSEKQFIITDDGSHTLFVPELNETYHSTHGAIQESRYVFIDQGLRFLLNKNKNGEIRVFEVGFGTGLNAFLSALFAEKYTLSIRYESIEAFPLNLAEIQQLNYAKLAGEKRSSEIFHKIHEASWGRTKAISRYFQLKKIQSLLQEYEYIDSFDVCFFDAFAPSKQPEMWEYTILKKIYSSLVFNGIFVTYCAKGQVKRDLKDIGFEVEMLPGPPGKMEMIRGIKT